jgi:hypothetical protein
MRPFSFTLSDREDRAMKERPAGVLAEVRSLIGTAIEAEEAL